MNFPLSNYHFKKKKSWKRVKLTCNENSCRPFSGVIHVFFFYCELTLVFQAHGLWTNVQHDEEVSVWTVFMHDNALTVFHALLAEQPGRKLACSGGGNKWLFVVCIQNVSLVQSHCVKSHEVTSCLNVNMLF